MIGVMIVGRNERVVWLARGFGLEMEGFGPREDREVMELKLVGY